MAARTGGVRFFIAALIAPFHDPLRLAEDMIALDNLSRGRVDVVVAGGSFSAGSPGSPVYFRWSGPICAAGAGSNAAASCKCSI